MANINTKFKKIISDLEENIKDEETLEYAKTQVFNLYNVLLDEVSRIEELATEKISSILEVQVQMESRVNKLEKDLAEMEKDIYAEESGEEITINCPYCNNQFILELDELKEEVECPECSNIIELDWGQEEAHEEHRLQPDVMDVMKKRKICRSAITSTSFREKKGLEIYGKYNDL